MMQNHSETDKNWMWLACALWLCSLPIAFIVAFFFGMQAGGALALGLLIVLLLICRVMCDWRPRGHGHKQQ